ncbi:hypothetical protein IWQ60_005429 [Tieghemiomyces parasiticus]|uniref:Uncharacterized protein n=1 Tax=Tieghemiomyces parasiticus TaxID=78921 RepID=A0A9W8ACE5_9FUNG|nr:hypothetical protein IWQ60_005429 [Tieghemiomyces parasiticus]
MATSLPASSPKRYGEHGGRWLDPEPLTGDYPNLPQYPTNEKPPLGWDNMQDRRNFGDVVQEQDEILGAWGPTVYQGNTRTVVRDWLCFSAFIGVIAGVAYLSYPRAHFTRRSYPYGGLHLELGGDPNNFEDRRMDARSHQDILDAKAE